MVSAPRTEQPTPAGRWPTGGASLPSPRHQRWPRPCSAGSSLTSTGRRRSPTSTSARRPAPDARAGRHCRRGVAQRANWVRPTLRAGPDVKPSLIGLRSPGASEPEPPRSVLADEDGMVGDAGLGEAALVLLERGGAHRPGHDRPVPGEDHAAVSVRDRRGQCPPATGSGSAKLDGGDAVMIAHRLGRALSYGLQRCRTLGAGSSL